MKKINLRFSYFLLLGIIGIVLQIIAFFSFTDVSITSINLTTSSTNKHFVNFISNNIVSLFSIICLISCFFGFLIAKKETNNKLFDISVISQIVIQSLLLIATIIYIVFSSLVREEMFSKTGNVDVLNYILMAKFILMILSFCSLTLFGLSFLKVKNNDRLSKYSTYGLIIASALSFIMFLIVISTFSINDSYSMLNNLYEAKLNPPYEKIYPSFNGFSLAQMIRLSYIPLEVESLGASSVYSFSAIFALSTQVIYLLSIAGNLVFLIIQLIESYDIERDSKPMAL